MRCTKPRQSALNKNFNLPYGSHVKKHDTRLLIGRIGFLTCGKSDTRHSIGLHRFANEILLCGFSVCKSQYVYNKINKPLSALLLCRLIMSLAERLSSKSHICPRSLASRPNVHFSDNLSAADIISRHTSRPKGLIFTKYSLRLRRIINNYSPKWR